MNFFKSPPGTPPKMFAGNSAATSAGALEETTPGAASPTPEPGTAADPAAALMGVEERLADANRRNAETISLLAAASESWLRQLRGLEELIAWLRRELEDKARRLTEREEELAQHEAALLPDGEAAETEQTLAARAEAAHLLTLAQQLSAEAQKIEGQIWPAGLRGEAWREWRAAFTDRAIADATAALLLARLHTLAALERNGQVDLELLRDLGRLFCRAAPDQAEPVANALNAAAGGQFELRTVRPGDRVDQRFMKPASLGLVEVSQALSWAVKDARQVLQFPAEVN